MKKALQFFVIATTAALVSANSFGQQYIITDLGTLGGSYSSAQAINNNGQIAGESNVVNPGGQTNAFLYSNGTMTNLGTLVNYPHSRSRDINNYGQVVGVVWNMEDLGTARAFVYKEGKMAKIGEFFPPSDSFANAINDNGDVVGQTRNIAFLYSNGIVTDIGYPNGYPSAYANDINSSGQIVGGAYKYQGSQNYYVVFTYNNGTITNLGAPFGTQYNAANSINDNGQIVGWFQNFQGNRLGFTYTNGSFQELSALPGAKNTRANQINNSGQIVGYSGVMGNYHATVYNNEVVADLNDLVAINSGWVLQYANAINDKGQIVGRGINPTGQAHAFLLTPVGNCQAYQVKPPVCAPIDRLAKWDGTNWVPVMPGDLSSGNIHVLVHGWAPGLRTFANDGGKIWEVNDPKTGVADNDYFAGMLTYSATTINSVAPKDTIVAFNWVDMSATETDNPFTEPRKSRKNTDEAGQFLAESLKSAGVSSGNFTGKIQIMGISHGARVSAFATAKLYDSGNPDSVVVNQLTLADSPENWKTLDFATAAKNRLKDVLLNINIGRAEGTTFVDNYYSYFGESYQTDDDIVNIQLHPPYSPIDVKNSHAYPIPWYRGATTFTSSLGLAWSPLEGDAYKTLSSNYEQDWTSGEYVLKDKDAGLSPVEKWLKLDLSTLLTEGLVTGIPGGMRLTEHSPAYWHTGFTKSANDNAIEFSYQFSNVGDGDQLTLWVDDEMRFVITGDLAGTGIYTTDVDISDLDMGSHILSIALNNYGDVNASVDVTNFTMVSVPEPASLFLFVGAIILLRKNRSK